MKKPAIPDAPNREGKMFDERVKEVLEVMQGRRRGVPRLEKLPETASTAEIIAAYNNLLDRLQA